MQINVNNMFIHNVPGYAEKMAGSQEIYGSLSLSHKGKTKNNEKNFG